MEKKKEKDIVIIQKKITGFSGITDAMELKVLLDRPYIPEGKRQVMRPLFGFLNYRTGEQCRGLKEHYYIKAGPLEPDMTYVYLCRKTRDVSGRLELSVIVREYETSIEEEREARVKIAADLADMQKVFGLGLGSSQPTESVEDLMGKINGLLSQKFKGYNPRRSK